MKKLYQLIVLACFTALTASGCRALDCGCPMSQVAPEEAPQKTTGLQRSATAR